MKNTQIILSVIGGFILGFLLYKVIKKYNSSRVGSSTDTTSASASGSVDTSTPTSTGVPIDPNSIERTSYKKTYRGGGDTNIVTYGRGGRTPGVRPPVRPPVNPPKGGGAPPTTQKMKCIATNPWTGTCITCKNIINDNGDLGGWTGHYPNCSGAE